MTKSMQEIIQEAYNEIPQINPEEALEMQNNGALIIDTRESNELAMTGKIKGAVHIPRGLIEFQNKETNPNGVDGFTKDKKIILYCAAGARAALAGKALKDLGFSSVYNLGGFPDWINSGLPVEKV
ncbi:rhodanese-like domain-containing protein [Hyphomicrobiales bacterium]|jgi:rhodanese-related sulfurtransferase|nr:rhodanese-like domain-containing protein [Hyphomicrobiales bacterium]MDA8892553.1 rhodanese-like domain-containing protein [Hyphomicrobiales bacterium]MDA9034743.1 rhodanese-like domain-containing protein [Hyphomicrobiales bacterium]MDA9903930.1 rhodanese-like domain-containing protein [Hyphomicrobiales bacterium]MDB9925818.1 rhodanese-like domain-containing protein [Hyphomicrobiales bacterium]